MKFPGWLGRIWRAVFRTAKEEAIKEVIKGAMKESEK